MKGKLAAAPAPAQIKQDHGASIQQKHEAVMPKQRAHNDSVPQQRKRKGDISEQRQQNTSLPVHKQHEGLLPAQRQPANQTFKAAAPSGTAASAQSTKGSAASLASQMSAPKSIPPSEEPLASYGFHPAADSAAGLRPAAYAAKRDMSQNSSPVYFEVVKQVADPPVHSTLSPWETSITTLQTGAPEVILALHLPPTPSHKMMDRSTPAANHVHEVQFAAPIPSPVGIQHTAGQAAVKELLDEAAAAPAQHSTAHSKAPESRYAVQQGMSQGYYDVWPAPAPCEGYYGVRALSEHHSSQHYTFAAPR